MSHLHFNEGSDYFGKMKSFAPPEKETKHVHVSAADLLYTAADLYTSQLLIYIYYIIFLQLKVFLSK